MSLLEKIADVEKEARGATHAAQRSEPGGAERNRVADAQGMGGAVC